MEFDDLKNVARKYYCSNYYDISINKYKVKCGSSLRFWENKGWINSINPYASINKYKVKCGSSLRFWENKGWINSINPYAWFQWYFRYWLRRRSLDKRQILNRKEL